MRLLLDTHVVVWWDMGRRLSREAERAVKNADAVYVSAVVGWEIAMKVAIGKLRQRRSVAELIAESDFEELPVRLSHAAALAGLPLHHRDPFDRMLAAQALAERLTLVSRDPMFAEYGVRTIAA